MYVLKAPERSDVSETNLSNVREQRTEEQKSTEETAPRIITPKHHLSQIKVCIYKIRLLIFFYLEHIFVE